MTGRKVVAWGALPPPVHGSTVMNAITQRTLASRGELVWLKSSPPEDLAHLGTIRAKALFVGVVALAKLAYHSARSSPQDIFYLSPAVRGLAGARDLVACLVASFGRGSVFVHLHTGDLAPLCPRILRTALKRPFVRMSCIVLLEQFEASVTALGVQRVHVLHNGVSCAAELHDNNQVVVRELRAVFLGNLIPTKGVATAAKCFRHLLEEGDERWTLTFAGASAGLMEPSLAELLRDHPDRVTLAGPVSVDQRCSLLANASVLLFPSAYPLEGSPLVLLEALEHGTVPFVTEWAGLVATAGPEARVVSTPQDMASSLSAFGQLPATERARASAACRRWWRAGWTQSRYESSLASLLGLQTGIEKNGIAP